MLNFFRKIRHKLIDDGNLKKYMVYATGEILLVMFGILLALQVNNWNETRKANRDEQQVLETLAIEFKENISSLDMVLNSHKNTIKKIEGVLDKYDFLNGFEITKNSLSEIRNAVLGKTYDPKFGVLNSLLNSDKINLIRNDSLRNEIAKMPGLLNDYSEDEQLAVSSIFEFYLPELFTINPNELTTENHLLYNFLNFLIPNIRSIIQEGDELKSEMIKISKLIEQNIN